jgi:hypothetical protein
MLLLLRTLLFFCLLITVPSCGENENKNVPATIQLTTVKVGAYTLNLTNDNTNDSAPANAPILVTFSAPLAVATVPQLIQLKLKSTGVALPLVFSFLENDKILSALPEESLKAGEMYELIISENLKGAAGEIFPGYRIGFTIAAPNIEIVALAIAGKDALKPGRLMDVPVEGATLEILFSDPLDPSTLTNENLRLTGYDNLSVPLLFSLTDGNKKIVVQVNQKLKDLRKYRFLVSDKLKGSSGGTITSVEKIFYTATDPEPKLPVISDDELLTLVQRQTFKYFWDFAHPASGMARERNTSGDIVTSGGSGFGIMAIIVAIERDFVSRPEGVQRLAKIVSYLETADRFHGAWSHWINGNTGDVIPFSAKDNGGDLVETSFLIQGLLTFRQYLEPSDTVGNNLINRINTLWTTVEWDWYRKNNEEVLYWHWSPNYTWEMNFPMYGYFEQQITYVLAAASPTHTIPKSVYSNGYGRNGAIKTGNTHYGYVLPLGNPAPLFWVHYSYLGLDPHFSDDYANYWQQNVNATLINQAYCIDNPRKYVGYSDVCWGLTSSDNQQGYAAHAPNNDLGVITPSAALSSFPYTPTASMKALKFFYYTVGDRLWGPYGFYDAINFTEGWTANSYLAIDQGPIIVMIENHRTGLLWNLFMSAPEIQAAKTKLGFH